MAAVIRRSGRSRERGAALVELALSLPLLLVLIAGIVDFALLFQRYEVLANAVREGARVAVLPGYSESHVKLRVRDYMKVGLGLNDSQLAAVMPTSPDAITVTCSNLSITPPGGTAQTFPTVIVSGAYNHSFLLLGPVMALINGSWGSSIQLTASSRMRLEPGASPCPVSP